MTIIATLYTTLVSGNKTFWKTGKPLFSDKMNSSHRITLINENKIISNNSEIAEISNEYFRTVVTKQGIDACMYVYICDTQDISDPIIAVIKKYEKHPSIIKIEENVVINGVFTFPPLSCRDVEEVVKGFYISRATTSMNISTKVFKLAFIINVL